MIERVPKDASVKEVTDSVDRLIRDWLTSNSNRTVVLGVGDASPDLPEDPEAEGRGLAMWLSGNSGMHAMSIAAIIHNLPIHIRLELELIMQGVAASHFQPKQTRPACCDKHKAAWNAEEDTSPAGEFAGLANVDLGVNDDEEEDEGYVH